MSTSYRSLVPVGVFLLVVNRKDGALQQRDRDILPAEEDSLAGGCDEAERGVCVAHT